MISAVLRSGCVAAGALVAAAWLSGPLRAASGLPLSLALALSLVLTAPLAWLALRAEWRRAPSTAAWLCGALLAAGAVTLTIAWLYNPAYDGMVTVGGGDAGNHVRLQQQFLCGNPRPYHGFVAFYALAGLLQHLTGGDVFRSFRDLLYLLTAAPLVFAAVVALTLAVRSGAGVLRVAATAFAFAASATMAARQLYLPLAHYLHADGFFAQWAGTVPIVAAFSLYGLIESRALRLAMLALALFACRYTYALNLGELLVTIGVLTVYEARALDSRWQLRALLTALGVATALAGCAFFCAVAELYGGVQGGMTPPSPTELARGTLALGLALASAVPLLRLCGLPPSPTRTRYLLFAALFSIAYAGASTAYRLMHFPAAYYWYKQGAAPTVLALLATIAVAAYLVPALVALVATLLRRRGARVSAWRAAATLAFVTVVAGCGYQALRRGDAVYVATYLERMSAPPSPHVFPLADREAWRRIDRHLSDEHARFGGLIVWSWPMSSFMNAVFGRAVSWRSYLRAELDPGPRRCVFWMSSEADRARYADVRGAWGAEADAVVRRLDADPGAQCEEYRAPWLPAQQQRLCRLCQLPPRPALAQRP